MTAFLALCLAATSYVAISGLPPILNQSFGLQRAINLGIIVGCAALIILLVGAIRTPRLIALGRVAAIVTLFFATLEIGLRIFDGVAISVDHSLVKIASHPVRAGDAEIFLPQSRPDSPLGFRWAHAEPVKKQGYRILLLGSSFIQGSGTSFATNYPQVFEAAMQRRFPDRRLTVMPAGVNGYGVVEELQLYRYLTRLGYDFDAVILHYMPGTDPSQDQAGTILTVIAGQKQRVHDSRFLQAFYPLNYYLMRYMIYFRSEGQQPAAASSVDAGRKDADGCPANPAYAASSRERSEYYYRAGGAGRVPIDVSLQALDAIGREAQGAGQKFMVVTLPDRNEALAGSRSRFAGQSMDWTWIRKAVAASMRPGWALEDLSEAYRDQPDLFLCGDGHWSDKGNVFAAKRVADFTSRQMR